MNEVNLKFVERVVYLELQRHIHHELKNFNVHIHVSSSNEYELVLFTLYDEETERKITVALSPFEFELFSVRMEKYIRAYAAVVDD